MEKTRVVPADEIYKSWVKSELYGGIWVANGGLIANNLPELYNLANYGDVNENEWKKLILLIKCVRGLYLIPDIVIDAVIVQWTLVELTYEELSQCRNWKFEVIVDNSKQQIESDIHHDIQVSTNASKYPYSWPDEPLIILTLSTDFSDYRIIDGNHRARRYIKEQKRSKIKCYVGLISH